MDVGTPVPTPSSRRHRKDRSSTGDDMKKSNTRRRSGGNTPSFPHRRKSTDTDHSHKALSRKKHSSQHSLKRLSAPFTPPNSSDKLPGRSKYTGDWGRRDRVWRWSNWGSLLASKSVCSGNQFKVQRVRWIILFFNGLSKSYEGETWCESTIWVWSV